VPGLVLHLGATVTCGHGGQAMPSQPMPRVLVSGAPVAVIGSPYAVAGCPFASAPGPCVTGAWIVGATRVFAMGMPVAINAGAGVCAPNGAPLLAAASQPRVIAT
jgi:hypothetical protein